MSVLHGLIKIGKDVQRIRQLLEEGENPNITDFTGNTPLHVAASSPKRNPTDIESSFQIVRELIKHGADLNKKKFCGETPVMSAIRAANRIMTEFLLQAGAQIDVTNNNGDTALHFAIKICPIRNRRVIGDSREPVLEMVKVLLRFPSDINSRNNSNETPLMVAVKYRYFSVVKELLKRNAIVHFPGFIGNSAMHYALCEPEINLNIVLELIRHGGQFYNPNRAQQTPMNFYVYYLTNGGVAELEKAKCVFKLFSLGDESFIASHERQIEYISEEKKFPLFRFILDCRKEVSQMLRDEIVPNCSVYNVAKRGFLRNSEEINHTPDHVFDAVLHKLMKCEYPIYCDLILSGIGTKYLRKTVAETCSIVEKTGSVFLNYDVLFSLSFYLSHLDMLNLMTAFSQDSTCN